MPNYSAQNLVRLGERSTDQRLANLEMNALYGPENQTTFPDVEDRAGMTLIYDENGHPALLDINTMVFVPLADLMVQMSGRKLYSNPIGTPFVAMDFTDGVSFPVGFNATGTVQLGGIFFNAGGKIQMQQGGYIVMVAPNGSAFSKSIDNSGNWVTTPGSSGPP